MPHDVFISYRRKDKEFVSQLYEALSQRGISAWFDKENIEVADHWRTSIAEGIRDCRVFILVLSPDAVQSVNIRKEVDLAEHHGKKIVPVIWRKTEIPPAFEYALAGIQWIDFQETASPENFDALADVVKRVLAGSSMAEATADKQITTQSPIPARETAPAPTGGRRLGGLRRRPSVSPIAQGGLVMARVVTTFELDVADQDFVNRELKWLFSATDHFLKVRRGEADRSQPLPVEIPETAERQSGANNHLLTSLDDFDMQLWESDIEAMFKRIDIHMKNLNILLEQEARMGEEGQRNLNLQSEIRNERLSIVKVLQELTPLMNSAYGVLVTSPDQLYELLR